VNVKLKVHKVTRELWIKAVNNVTADLPILTINLESLCGADALIIAYKWGAVTCKNCQRKRK
jgi:hypothetical protein